MIGRTPFGVLQMIHQQQAQTLALVGAGLERLAMQLLELLPCRLHGGMSVPRQLLQALADRPVHIAHSAPVAAVQRRRQALVQHQQTLRVTCGRH